MSPPPSIQAVKDAFRLYSWYRFGDSESDREGGPMGGGMLGKASSAFGGAGAGAHGEGSSNDMDDSDPDDGPDFPHGAGPGPGPGLVAAGHAAPQGPGLPPAQQAPLPALGQFPAMQAPGPAVQAQHVANHGWQPMHFGQMQFMMNDNDGSSDGDLE